MEMEMHNLRNVGAALAEVSNALSELTGDGLTRELLRANAQRLSLGAVRLAVLGNSNAGKSTLINALLRVIAVPESGNTASPIPVWFAAGDELRYSVYTRTEDGERCGHPDTETFIRQYCYNLMDIADDKRVRFSDVLWASAEVQSDFLKKTGFTLIDTLGINATEADTVKTIATIDAGVDVVIFVTARVDLLDSDLRFLREHVLGYGERDVPYPVRPSQLLLVYNDKGMAGATLDHLEHSAEKLLDGAPPAEIEAFKRNNLIMLNALAARRMRCGAYDYEHFAPEGTLDMERSGLEQRTKSEQAAVEKLKLSEAAKNRTEPEQNDGGCGRLEKRLAELANQMMTNENGVVERRIIRLREVMDAIRVQANTGIGKLQKEKADVQKEIQAIASVNEVFKNANKDITPVFEKQRAAMRLAIRTTLEANRKPAINALVGSMFAMAKPAFITDQDERTFRSSATDLQRIAMLSGWIRRILENNFIPEASKKFKKLLLEANVQEGGSAFTVQHTVRYQVEAARRLSLNQSVRMKVFCEELRDKGAGNIGLAVPTDDTLEDWFAGMASEMETAILEAIAKLQYKAYNRLDAQMGGIVQQIQVKGIIKRIQQFLGIRNHFWEAIRDNAVVPAAGMVCCEWFNTSPSDSGADMYGGIDEAYKRVQDKVISSLNSQTAQVDECLVKLQIKLENRQKEVEQASAASGEITRRLDEQEKKLNSLRSQKTEGNVQP